MFLVINNRFREVFRTPSATDAVQVKQGLNDTKAFRAFQPFSIAFLPEELLPELDNVVLFPKRR